jgi:hypothetical protein
VVVWVQRVYLKLPDSESKKTAPVGAVFVLDWDLTRNQSAEEKQ